MKSRMKFRISIYWRIWQGPSFSPYESVHSGQNDTFASRVPTRHLNHGEITLDNLSYVVIDISSYGNVLSHYYIGDYWVDILVRMPRTNIYKDQQ